MSAAGFVIERFVEPLPLPEFRDVDPEDFALLNRSPCFIMLRARKEHRLAVPD